MFIRKPVLVAIATLALLGTVLEWQFASAFGSMSTAHRYHGLCNGGVGWPYSKFVHELRTLAESGDTNRLAQILRRADDESHQMFEVWLAEKPFAYKSSLDEILK
jgi:hypothetical protein